MSDFVSALTQAGRSSSVLDRIANPPQVNWLGSEMAGAQAANTILGVQKTQSEKALGELYQQAIDPKTGRFDPLLFNQLIARTPAAAFSAGTGVTNSQAQQTNQYNLSHAQNNGLNAALAGVLKLPDDQLAQGVLEQTQRMISAGLIPPDRAHSALLGLNGQDPKVLRQQLETMWRGTLPSEQQQTVTYGTVTPTTLPGGVQGVTVVDPTRGTIRLGQGQVPLGVSPADLLREVTVPDLRQTIDGKPNPGYLQDRRLPLWQFYGMPRPPVMGGPPGTGGNTGDVGTGRPPALVNPNGPQPPASTSAPPPAPYTQPVTPSPGQKQEAENAANQFKAEVDRGDAAVQRQAQLGTMLSDLTGFTSGSGASKVLDFKRAMVSWAPTVAGWLRITPEEVRAGESFEKVAAQLVAAQNSGSDSRMNLNLAATPHSGQSPEGVDFIIRTLQGNEDYLQARKALSLAWPSRSDYNSYLKSITPLDPRVFQLERFTEQQREDYWKSLDRDPNTKKAIANGIRYVAKLREAGQL